MSSLPSDTEIDRRARRNAGAKMGWYIHAAVFLAVNLLLVSLAAASGRHWAMIPTLGWAVGLAIHGAVVFLSTSGVRQRMEQRERERLMGQKDAW